MHGLTYNWHAKIRYVLGVSKKSNGKLFIYLFCDFECRFCIIEGPETVQDFAKMELQEIHDNIRSRRNKIFLHMEEVNLRYFASR